MCCEGTLPYGLMGDIRDEHFTVLPRAQWEAQADVSIEEVRVQKGEKLLDDLVAL